MPEGYAITWVVVILVAVVGVGAIGVMFLANRILAPRRPSKIKASPYECGIEPTGRNWSQMHFRYYVFAILFLIFDVEAVFLFPWAAIFLGPEVAAVVFYEMLMFMAILSFGLFYSWKKGVLQWR